MDSPIISDRLDRHQASRDQARPTISVLAGPLGHALESAHRWAAWRGRSVVAVDGSGIEAMVGALVAHLGSGVAVEWLASRLDRPADALRSRIARMSSIERNLFLDAHPTGAGPGTEAACRWILEQPGDGPIDALRLGQAIAVGPGDSPIERAWAALGEMIPVATGPVLLVSPKGEELEQAARSIDRLTSLHPGIAILVAVDSHALDTYLKISPESRGKAMLRSGVIDVPIPEVVPRHPLPDAPPRDDGARSEVERFLFDRLEATPATSGLFVLNDTIDIPFGPGRMMEVDLLCRDLGIAIEVDGYYHFQNADAYRRDRRKDFLLQSHGYLVIRVLADDVVPEQEAIVRQVVAAIARRRSSPDARDTFP